MNRILLAASSAGAPGAASLARSSRPPERLEARHCGRPGPRRNCGHSRRHAGGKSGIRELPSPVREYGFHSRSTFASFLRACRVLTNDREVVPATPNQRVRVPPRQVPERLVAGPRGGRRLPQPKRGVESLYGGSKRAGRNMK